MEQQDKGFKIPYAAARNILALRYIMPEEACHGLGVPSVSVIMTRETE